MIFELIISIIVGYAIGYLVGVGKGYNTLCYLELMCPSLSSDKQGNKYGDYAFRSEILKRFNIFRITTEQRKNYFKRMGVSTMKYDNLFKKYNKKEGLPNPDNLR